MEVQNTKSFTVESWRTLRVIYVWKPGCDSVSGNLTNPSHTRDFNSPIGVQDRGPELLWHWGWYSVEEGSESKEKTVYPCHHSRCDNRHFSGIMSRTVERLQSIYDEHWHKLGKTLKRLKDYFGSYNSYIVTYEVHRDKPPTLNLECIGTSYEKH